MESMKDRFISEADQATSGRGEPEYTLALIDLFAEAIGQLDEMLDVDWESLQ